MRFVTIFFTLLKFINYSFDDVSTDNKPKPDSWESQRQIELG
jgi:hypothetical protein